MKRIISVTLLLAMLLTGCSGLLESKPVTKIYTYSETMDEGVDYDEKWTVEGMDDDMLHKTTVTYTYTFDDAQLWAESIEELTTSMDEEIEKLQGPFGSPYITIEYTMDGNALIATETTDYKTAADDGKSVEGQLDGGLMTSKEYYSISKVCEQLEDEGYTLAE